MCGKRRLACARVRVWHARTARNVGELDLLGLREVAREADAVVGGDDAEEGGHRHAAVLDLHLHKAAVALRALRSNREQTGGVSRAKSML